ncbi:MAG: TlpA family protein disulfide reductase [Isosphaeraceae bacterium]
MKWLHATYVLSAMIGVLGPLAAACGAAGLDEVPRYRLSVGQELKYHGTSDFKYQDGLLAYQDDWTVWVVRANDDGSWRIIARSSSRMSATRAGKKDEDPPDVTIAHFDLYPDGRIVSNKSFGYRFDPSPLFPRLPKDAAEAKNGWQGINVRDEKRTDFKQSGTAGSPGDEWVFEGVDHGMWDKIYLMSAHSRYVLDVRKGVVKRVDSENAQGYGIRGKGSGSLLLTALTAQNPDQIRTLDRESERYFAANQEYEDLISKASKDADRVTVLLSQAETVLKDAKAALGLPILREQIDEQLKNHTRMASYYTDRAKSRGAVIGHPSADWETKDLEGKTHSLAAYRGKVVILDFWYRGCGWCIRAMPQVKQLAEDFQGQPVAVLGMNTDRQEKDAKFVVDAMGLNYPVLKAEGLPEKYQVRGFPTLIIIDQDGKVAEVHVGYSATLREDVSKSVKTLLRRPRQG